MPPPRRDTKECFRDRGRYPERRADPAQWLLPLEETHLEIESGFLRAKRLSPAELLDHIRLGRSENQPLQADLRNRFHRSDSRNIEMVRGRGIGPLSVVRPGTGRISATGIPAGIVSCENPGKSGTDEWLLRLSERAFDPRRKRPIAAPNVTPASLFTFMVHLPDRFIPRSSQQPPRFDRQVSPGYRAVGTLGRSSTKILPKQV